MLGVGRNEAEGMHLNFPGEDKPEQRLRETLQRAASTGIGLGRRLTPLQSVVSEGMAKWQHRGRWASCRKRVRT